MMAHLRRASRTKDRRALRVSPATTDRAGPEACRQGDSPRQVGSLPVGDTVTDVAFAGAHVYLATRVSGVLVVSVAPPTAPMQVARRGFGGVLDVVARDRWAFLAEVCGGIKDVDVQDRLAYVADSLSGLAILDISDPRVPVRLGFVPLRGVYGVDVAGEFAFVVLEREDDAAFAVIDVSDPRAPRAVWEGENLVVAMGVMVRGTIAYVVGHGLLTFDISSARSPRPLGAADRGLLFQDVQVDAERAYAGNYRRGLYVYDVGDPATPRKLWSIDTLDDASGLWRAAPYVYIAAHYAGLQVFRAPGDPLPPRAFLPLVTGGR